MAYIRQSKMRTTVVAGMPLRFGDAPVTDSCTLFSARRRGAVSRLSGHFRRFAHFGRGREAIEGGHHTAFFVWYAREAQAHFDPAQSSGQHQVVETAEMSDAKGFASELA